ncbi:hypothetical protein LY76DRAFT_165542 [Colletotrichum caudatum]|nr:hypothetical protein LY76DRAFT_165542 [Colletotrichum caudatum]
MCHRGPPSPGGDGVHVGSAPQQEVGDLLCGIWRFRHLRWPCIQGVCLTEGVPASRAAPHCLIDHTTCMYRYCIASVHKTRFNLSRAERKWAVGSGWQGGVWIFDLGRSDWCRYPRSRGLLCMQSRMYISTEVGTPQSCLACRDMSRCTCKESVTASRLCAGSLCNTVGWLSD